MAEPQIIGALIASAAYGVAVQLSVQCVQLLLRTKHIHSKALHRFICCYVASTLLIATAACVQGAVDSVYILRLFLRPSSPLSYGPGGITPLTLNTGQFFFFEVPILFPFAVANADTFMVRTQRFCFRYILIWQINVLTYYSQNGLREQIWRCFRLYSNASWGLRMLIYTCSSLSVIASIGELIFNNTLKFTYIMYLSLSGLVIFSSASGIRPPNSSYCYVYYEYYHRTFHHIADHVSPEIHQDSPGHLT